MSGNLSALLPSGMAPNRSANPAASPDLPWPSWLAQAQERHAQAPQAVAAELALQAASMPADAVGAELIALAEHVWLGHLADAAGLQAFVDHLPAELHHAEAITPVLQRLAWALACLAGQPATDPAALPDLLRWRALQNVVLAMAWQGRCEAASALLLRDEGLAAGHGNAPAGRAFAASANNIASDLCDGPRGDAARDALMLTAAALSRRAWGHAGTGLQVERAEYRLALCHAAVGLGAAAVHHARQCLLLCQAEGGDPMELFFAYEATVRAQLVIANANASTNTGAVAAAAARQQMQALLPGISEADGLRAWCAATLQALPPA